MGVFVGVGWLARLVWRDDGMCILQRTSEPQESQTVFGGWGVALIFIPYEQALPCQLVSMSCKLS